MLNQKEGKKNWFEVMFRNRVAILGSVSIDTIEIPETPPFQKLGGVVIYGGLTWVQHGLKVDIFCNVSPKDQWILDFFQQHGLKWQGKLQGETTQFLNRIHEDSRVQEVKAIAEPIQEIALPQLKETDLVYLGPLHPNDIHPDVVERLASTECRIALDIQGYTRKIENGKVLPQVWPDLERVLKRIHVLKADAFELELVLKAFGMDIHKFQTHFGIEEVIVTQGKNGGYWSDFSGKKIHYVPPHIVKKGDPTGAGDVFFSAYLWARLFQNQSVEKALAHGAIISIKQIQGNFIPQAELMCK